MIQSNDPRAFSRRNKTFNKIPNTVISSNLMLILFMTHLHLYCGCDMLAYLLIFMFLLVLSLLDFNENKCLIVILQIVGRLLDFIESHFVRFDLCL